MNRRPWPILLLAVLQFLSPLIYIIVASFFYGLSVQATANEILALTPELRKFEIFVLQVLLGGLILMTRRTGYYFVIVGSIYLIVRGVIEFVASNQTDPVFPLVLTNLLCAAVIAYLVRPRTRMIYFNPRMRWWETEARYVVGFPASIVRVGGKACKAKIQNIAVGGAGVDTVEKGFLKDEIVDLEFQYEGETYRMKSKIVWEQDIAGSQQFIGIQWAESNANADRSKMRRLTRELKKKGFPTTRKNIPWWSDLKARLLNS